MSAIVTVENVSKKYWISHEENHPHASLKEMISHRFFSYYKKWRGDFSVQEKFLKQEEFWAIKHLSFSIQEGERVALLGRNGAGKSTFLKLLARITEPTSGRIKIRGRVASLLEVGTGFHPELTGKENIYLNGAIMGMSYREIRSKFDEIVAFADVEKFLDTPIKKYSSGMFMRLGFAIAAHLESELLILDEVLAVGDAQFQEKCLNKMKDIGKRGSTILFVSHNMQSVLSLCSQGILLEKGELRAFGSIENCVNTYIENTPSLETFWTGCVGNDMLKIHRAEILSSRGAGSSFFTDEVVDLQIELEVEKPSPDLILGFRLMNSCHQVVAQSFLCDADTKEKKLTECKGKHLLSFPLDCSLFHPGDYQVHFDCFLPQHKNILNNEISLKFSIHSPPTLLRNRKEGISLGNRWRVI